MKHGNNTNKKTTEGEKFQEKESKRNQNPGL